jgi:hypothetical protein
MQQPAELCLPDLSPDEGEALRAYKKAFDDTNGNGRSPCFDLNRDLRNGLWVDELEPALRKIAEGLDSVFSRCPRLAHPITVYRAVGTRAHLPLNESGRRFRSLEYWSTAHSEVAIEGFLTPAGSPAYGAILQLQLPAGCPAYNMESLPGFGGHEAELLLPRGMLWTVESAALVPEAQISLPVRAKFKNVVRAALTAEAWHPPPA